MDHQAVNILFENNVTATLTMTAFTKEENRETRIMGTMGEITGSFIDNIITVKPFLGEEISYRPETLESGHGGADTFAVADFLASVKGEKAPCTPIDISVESHAMCAAAELSRKSGRSVKINEVLYEKYKA